MNEAVTPESKIADAIARYDLAKRQEKDWDKEEIKELRIILAALCRRYGELHIYDKDRVMIRGEENIQFEWKYEPDNMRHTLRLRDE